MPAPLPSPPPANRASPELARRAREVRARRIELARENINVFIPFVMRSQRTGMPIELAPIHREWQDLCDANRNIMLWAPPETGKTSIIPIARTLFRLGQNPSRNFAIVGEKQGAAKKIVGVIKKYIEDSKELHEVFPNLQRDHSAPWTSTELFVNRPVFNKDPSVRAVGFDESIIGSRVTDMFLDDIVSWKNSRTEEQREKGHSRYLSEFESRLEAGATVVGIGNAYHPKDTYHTLAKNSEWVGRRYPILNDKGESTWPEAWSLDRIDEKRRKLGPLEFARQMLCKPRDDGSARFKDEWIKKALEFGNGRALAKRLRELPPGFKTYTGVDLAVQQHSAADLTCFFTIIVHPNGNREILSIESGRFTGPEIVSKMIDHHDRYKCILVVENNAAQDFILQFARGATAIPMRPYTTGKQKAHPEFGIESMAVELANGKWIIPNRDGVVHPEIDAWINEMLYYSPDAHTGDRLMASWFAREGVRMGSITVEFGNIDLMSR
jgi:hypothetical protein